MILEEKEIGGYFGIYREVVLLKPSIVLIRFNALGNDEIDIEFRKEYASEKEAKEKITQYIKTSINPTTEELGPVNNDWKEFEIKVNTSIIKLMKDSLSNQVFLPDGGKGFNLKNSIDNFNLCIEKYEQGVYVRYVDYRDRLG